MDTTVNQRGMINQKAMVRGIEFLNAFREATGNEEIQAQAIHTFLYVAYRYPNPVPQVEIEKSVKLSQTTTSRNVGYWAKGAGKQPVGYGMFKAEPDPYYRKRILIELTPKGLKFAAKLSVMLGN